MRSRALLVVCGVAFSCCDSGPTTPTPAPCAFSLSATSVAIAAEGGPGSISVSTGRQCHWTARSETSWITVTSEASVTGPGSFGFTIAASNDTIARTGAVTVAGQSVPVSQQGLMCAFTLLPLSRSFDAVGGGAAVEVTTTPTCTWTVGSTASWLAVTSAASATGSSTVTYTVAPNADASSRHANLTVGDRTHAVTQAGLPSCTVTIDADDEVFPVSGGSGYFDVSAPATCAWRAASTVNWIRVTEPAGGSGAGTGRVSYSVDASSEAGQRTGTIVVGGQTFVATQTGTSTCSYSVMPVESKVCETGGERTVTVDTVAGCGWTASTAAPWITISSGQTGMGPGTVRFWSLGNSDTARQGTIAIRWPTPTAGQNVRVAQAGCTYSFSPDSLDIPAGGGDFLVYVISGSTDSECGGRADDHCVWSAQSNAPWITVLSSMPRSGWERFSFRVAANGSATPRTSTMTVQYRTVTVRQAGI